MGILKTLLRHFRMASHSLGQRTVRLTNYPTQHCRFPTPLLLPLLRRWQDGTGTVRGERKT